METGSDSKEKRLVFYSDDAAHDAASIHTYTVQTWGEDQAELYLNLIDSELERLARGDCEGQELDDFPGLRRWLVRWPGAYYSHWVIYRASADQLVVVRILHTSMNLPDHIKV